MWCEGFYLDMHEVVGEVRRRSEVDGCRFMTLSSLRRWELVCSRLGMGVGGPRCRSGLSICDNGPWSVRSSLIRVYCDRPLDALDPSPTWLVGLVAL